MWDKTYGCAKQYRCFIPYYMMSFLSKSYQNVLDRSADTPGDVKYIVDGFNDFQKQYLAIYLRMRSTPGVYKIGSNCMRVHAMTEKGKVIFAK